MPQKKFFKVDAKAVLTLGRNSIKDHTTAVVELIKNAYDADADTVDLWITSRPKLRAAIRIADNGHGMTEREIEDHWLRIGFSEKVENRTSQQFRRRKTGEKGIGRLSADRLGAVLHLKSKRRRHPSVGLKVDWSKFEVPGREIGQVDLPTLDDSTPEVPARRTDATTGSGTELLITNLRQSWTSEDIEKLHSELSLLLPPYQQIARTFSIRFHNDVVPELNGVIRYGSSTKGEIEFSAKMSRDGSLEYRMHYFEAGNRNSRRVAARSIPWQEIAPDPAKDAHLGPCKLGTLSIRLSYFVRRVDLLEGTGLQLGQLRQYLERNAGVRVYRDLVRVKPYGDPSSTEADWLGLGPRKTSDPAGARRKSFKIAPSQLVGAVFAGRDITPELIDSSSREGLIENDAFRQLKAVLMRCINIIEAKYHEVSFERPKDRSKAARAKASVKSLTGNLSNLSAELSDLQQKFTGDLGDDFASVAEQIGLVIEQAQAAQKDIDELADQNTVFRGLATVGIASAIFGHETATAISQADAKVRIARKLLTKAPPNILLSTERLDEATKYMERVASWGKFALSRVNKDKRQKRKVSVSSIVTAVLNDLEGPMSSADVELKRAVSEEVEARTFPMDIEAVLINFLTNAYHEVKRHQGERVIRVRLVEKRAGAKEGFELSVADNGGGIPPEYATTIWEPLFSTKTDERGRATGTGLGLAIVKSAVEELNGQVAADSTGPLGGAIFRAWFPRGM